MAVLTQGTEVFFVDPNAASPEVTKVQCATSFSPGGAPSAQHDTTCLDDTTFKRYVVGLRDPQEASLTIRADPSSPSHIDLFSKYNPEDGTPAPELIWLIGWSDGTDEPTWSASDVDLPDTRTWLQLKGYVADFPFDFEGETTVSTEISIQRTGGLKWTKKE